MKKLLNLENLIYLSIILLPSYLIKINIFGIPTNFLEILISICLVWWVFEKRYRNTDFKYKKIKIAVFLIIFGLFISTFVNENYKIGLGIIKGWFVFPILLIFISRSVIQNRENIFKAFYGSAFFVGSVGLAYFFLDYLTYDGRLKAFFNSPNYLAMYLAPAFIFGCYFFRQNRKVYGISLMVIVLSLYLTFSYTAWLAMISAIFAIEIIKNKKHFFQSKAFVLIIFSIIFLFLIQLNNRKINDLSHFYERSSIASRVMIWKASEKILKDNWLWGIGPGNFQNKYLEYQKFFPSYLEWAVPHPHNIFLAFWLVGGILSFIGFFSLIFFWFREIFKIKNSQLKFAVFGMMLYILIHGFFDTTYFKNDLAVIFWMLFLIL